MVAQNRGTGLFQGASKHRFGPGAKAKKELCPRNVTLHNLSLTILKTNRYNGHVASYPHYASDMD